MSEISISVVICTYNRSEYLIRCLKSLKQLNYPCYEIIVVNGPSTDNTEKVLAEYPDIVKIRQTSLNGLSYARNLGIKAAKGDIIAFIDDDAIADPGWLKNLVVPYQETAVGGVGGPVYEMTGKWYQHRNGYISKEGIPSFVNDIDPDYNNKNGKYYNYTMGTNSSFRKDILFKVGLFDENYRYYLDETDVCVRVIKAGYKIRQIENVVVFHEMAEGHNRNSPYDINYSEIVKNNIYFILKNFSDEKRSYTLRPCLAFYYWIKIAYTHYFQGTVSLYQFLKILGKIFNGSLHGYWQGLHSHRLMKSGIRSTADPDKYYSIDQDAIQSKSAILEKNKSDDEIPLKIVLVSQEYSRICAGGNCRHTYILAHGLAKLGQQVHVISRSERESEYDYMDEDVFVHKILPRSVEGLKLSLDMGVSKKNLDYSYAVCLKLFDLVEKNGIDIVESVSWDAEAFIFSLYKTVPLVVRIVTPLFKLIESQGWDITLDKKLAHWIEGETVRRSDKVIAISNAIGKLFHDHHNVSMEKVVYCPLGCGLPDEKLLIREQDENNINVLFVGRLEKRKGIDILFKAIPQVLNANENVQFWIAGKDTNLGPGGQSFEKYLSGTLTEKQLSHVNFFGFVSEQQLNELYRTCDILVAPSLYESFGQIYIEAMAWGKPVIGCNVGGVPEVVQDGVTGFIVPPENHIAIANAIIKLTNKNVARMIGSNGRNAIENYFSIDNFIVNSLRIYKDVITNKKCPKNVRVVSFDSSQILKNDEYNIQYQRFKWSCELIQKYLSNFNLLGKICLDVGCGQGNMVLALKKFGAKKVIGSDINFKIFSNSLFCTIAREELIDTRGTSFIEGDLNNISDTLKKMDLVTMHDVIEHVENLRGLLSTIYNILKPGGLLFISSSPLFYSPIGHHCWYVYSKERHPWVHLYDDNFELNVRKINSWAADRYLELNKLTVSELEIITHEIGFKLIYKDTKLTDLSILSHPNKEQLISKVNKIEDLLIEEINVILQK